MCHVSLHTILLLRLAKIVLELHGSPTLHDLGDTDCQRFNKGDTRKWDLRAINEGVELARPREHSASGIVSVEIPNVCVYL